MPWSEPLKAPLVRAQWRTQQWDLPPEFATLRRLMEARMLKMGRREYVQARTPARDLWPQ